MIFPSFFCLIFHFLLAFLSSQNSPFLSYQLPMLPLIIDTYIGTRFQTFARRLHCAMRMTRKTILIFLSLCFLFCLFTSFYLQRIASSPSPLKFCHCIKEDLQKNDNNIFLFFSVHRASTGYLKH